MSMPDEEHSNSFYLAENNWECCLLQDKSDKRTLKTMTTVTVDASGCYFEPMYRWSYININLTALTVES